MKTISLTLAQYRRAVRGEKLPVARYRHEHASTQSLQNKQCWHVQHGHWLPTPLGMKVHAARGRLRPGREVYDSATPQERQALGRSHTPYATKEEQHVAEQLRERMREAGEIPR